MVRDSNSKPSGSGIHVVSSSSAVTVPLSNWISSNILTLLSVVAFGAICVYF